MQITDFLFGPFLEAMNDIGRYGHEKYAEESFHAKAARGDLQRGDNPRVQSAEIMAHAAEHFKMYLRGELHDHFETLEHQLAAVAFNAMMEFYFLKQESANSKQGYLADPFFGSTVNTSNEVFMLESSRQVPAG